MHCSHLLCKYLLDGNFETFDETQPTTNYCPLLPGQTVNILEVPFEQCEEPSRRASISTITAIASIHTLKPADRFQRPRPDSNPKYSRLLTSPSKLQKEVDKAKSPIDVLAALKNSSTIAVPIAQSHLTDTQSSIEKPIRDSDGTTASDAKEFADFDFNNFQPEVHDFDEHSEFIEEDCNDEDGIEPIVRPRSDDYYRTSRLAKIGYARHLSFPTARFNSAPEIFSPLRSHPVSDVLHRQRFSSAVPSNTLLSQHQMLDQIYEYQIPAAATQLYLPADTRPSTAENTEEDAKFADRPRSRSIESFTFGDKLTEMCEVDGDGPQSDCSQSLRSGRHPGQPSLSSHAREYSDNGHHGFDMVSSPTCGSLTEDVSDESFVTSSASSDIWSPHVHPPFRLGSPSIEISLHRPNSSSSREDQADFDNDITGTFRGYSLPDEAGQSQSTLTKTITPKATPRLVSDSQDRWLSSDNLRESMPSLPTLPKMDSLLDDLSFLGDAIS